MRNLPASLILGWPLTFYGIIKVEFLSIENLDISGKVMDANFVF